HKSQGSEFDNVLFILPERESPVLTRELIYTGITRAKKNVEIWGNEDVFCTAVSRYIKRTSGLRDALWNKKNGLAKIG
ncbi:MAG: ATP-binding domain-containing protein, partial [Desulfatiglandales bacterium]